LTHVLAASSKMFEDAFAQVHFVAQVQHCNRAVLQIRRILSSRFKQAQALADSPDVVVPVQIWSKADSMITMQGSCDVPMSPLLTAAALLAGRSTRPRINKPALAPMDQWFPVRSSAGSLIGRVRMVCEVAPVSVNLDDSVTAESGSFVPQNAAPAAATVDANVSVQPSLEVLEIMRARLRTEVILS
jgi:hypothetical protein